MQLRQINVAYRADEDRLLLRVSTGDAKEFRFWLTRRLLKRLWPALLGVLSADPKVVGQASRAARQHVLSFQHEQAVSQVTFSRGYRDDGLERPLGESPLLVSLVKVRRGKGGAVALAMRTSARKGIDLNLDHRMSHSFARLLVEAVGKTDWDMDLGLGGEDDEVDRRVVN